uniref:Uncharacterized protein n=1 Tax=Panagrolaimus sp. JU765 TaxID=591449 RepID=A0AC34PXY3_9BILA
MKTQNSHDFETSVKNANFAIALSRMMAFQVEAMVLGEDCKRVEIKNDTISSSDLAANNETLLNYNVDDCKHEVEPTRILLIMPPCYLLAVKEEKCRRLMNKMENEFPFHVGSLFNADELLNKLKRIKEKTDH